MKVPSRHTFEVSVSGKKTPVHFVDEFMNSDAHGYADYKNECVLIRIKPSCPMDTYIHELFHVWFYLAGRGGRDFTHQLNDEMLASMMESFLIDLFRNNGEAIFNEFKEHWYVALQNQKNAVRGEWVEI